MAVRPAVTVNVGPFSKAAVTVKFTVRCEAVSTRTANSYVDPTMTVNFSVTPMVTVIVRLTTDSSVGATLGLCQPSHRTSAVGGHRGALLVSWLHVVDLTALLGLGP